ncbi:MAG: alpha/beta hydrolase [Candidatus Pacebacteria bacterium]|nr:alpha/beta hydrolase [Candidatus Paceibacterota bacterium]
MEFQQNLIIINNRKVFYLDNNASGKVLILLHGFPGNHLGLLELANLIGEGYRIVIPDLPACGKSDPLVKAYLADYENWLDTFLDSFGVEKVSIMGHSFGSRVALVYSGNHPDRVEGLILIAPVLRVEGVFDRIISAYYSLAGVMPEYMKRMMLSNGLGKKVGDMVIFKSKNTLRRKEIMKRDAEEVKRIDTKTSMEIFDEFNNYDLVPSGKKVKTDSLVIAGGLDEISPIGAISDLASLLPNAELEVIEEGGHLIPLEEPEKVARIIRRWLDR